MKMPSYPTLAAQFFQFHYIIEHTKTYICAFILKCKSSKPLAPDVQLPNQIEPGADQVWGIREVSH